MWRHVASNTLTLLVVVLFLAGAAMLWGMNAYRAPGPLSQAICLRVPEGGTFRQLSNDLVAQGAITSPTILRIGADYEEKTTLLKAGSFLVPAGASMAEIVDIVTRGGASTCGTVVALTVGVTRNLVEVRELDPATNRFVELVEFDPVETADPPAEYLAARESPDTQYVIAVVEGTTAWQVVQALNGFDVLAGDVSDVPPEGSLAPDSYSVSPGETVAAFLARMASAQSAILAEEWAQRADGLPFDTPEEAMVLASIIEKETSVAEERPIVSSVLVNRLKAGMRLQFDPTIIYGITRGAGPLDRPISLQDIAGTTERRLHGAILYNTYQIDGLPAGPIANPGRASIRAALNPAETPYLFFVADGTGGHAFAATLEEHNRNVERYRALQAEAGGG